MTRIAITIIIATSILIAVSVAAFAAPKCAYTPQVMLGLERYGESLVEARTLPAADGSGPVEWQMWVNAETGSWTFIGTRGPVTCVFAGGLDGYRGQTIGQFVLGKDA